MMVNSRNSSCRCAIEWDVAGVTDRGRARDNNQDQFLIARLDRSATILDTSVRRDRFDEISGPSSALLLAVADGVGGTDAGAEASDTAMSTLTQNVVAVANCYYSLDAGSENDLIDRLERSVEEAHQAVREQTSPGTTAATTLTMVLLVGDRAYVLHVGDTRVYWLRASGMKMVTRDQTLAQELIDHGRLDENELETSPFGNVLVQALGSGRAIPAVGVIDLDPGDSLLLCSDGLTRHVDDRELEDLLSEKDSAKASCETMLERALEEGGLDNITVIVARARSQA